MIGQTKRNVVPKKMAQMAKPASNPTGIPEEPSSVCPSVEDTTQMKTSVGDANSRAAPSPPTHLLNTNEPGYIRYRTHVWLNGHRKHEPKGKDNDNGPRAIT